MTPDIDIRLIRFDKRRYMPLMLLGDESEPMVVRYLDRGDLWVGFADEVPVAVCVATDEGHGVTEVKNLAVRPDFQRRGIGRRMLAHVESLNAGRIVTLGTGETPSTLRFYKSCGYRYSHRVPDFFTDNYPEPIIEEGVELKDMVYLSKHCAVSIHYSNGENQNNHNQTL